MLLSANVLQSLLQLAPIHLPGRPWSAGSKVTSKVTFLKMTPHVWLHLWFYFHFWHPECPIRQLLSLYSIWVRTTVLLHHWCKCSSFTIKYFSLLNLPSKLYMHKTTFAFCLSQIHWTNAELLSNKIYSEGRSHEKIVRNMFKNGNAINSGLVSQVRLFCILQQLWTLLYFPYSLETAFSNRLGANLEICFHPKAQKALVWKRPENIFSGV